MGRAVAGQLSHRAWLGLLALSHATLAQPLSLLTYNVAGNGATDWSTNSPQVQAIGRQMGYLRPDVITFNEIPFTNSWEMTNFIKAYLPGHQLAINSGTDGFIRSAIASRHPIVRSQKWLDGVDLTGFGCTNCNFTRDLFEAEIDVPGYSNHLHVFTTHLKAGVTSSDASRRGAEASAISNFFVTTFLPSKSQRPYVLTGDMNEDVARPPSPPGVGARPLERLTNAATDLRLTTPLNPVTSSERTFSIRDTLSARLDYVLPGGLLFSNIASNQVFRTDVLNPLPSPLKATDSHTASDHLPVLVTFHNPYDTVFRLTSLELSNQVIRLTWQTTPSRRYRVEASTNLLAWSGISVTLTATTNTLTWTTEAPHVHRFYRIYRLP